MPNIKSADPFGRYISRNADNNIKGKDVFRAEMVGEMCEKCGHALLAHDNRYGVDECLAHKCTTCIDPNILTITEVARYVHVGWGRLMWLLENQKPNQEGDVPIPLIYNVSGSQSIHKENLFKVRALVGKDETGE